MDCNCLQYNNKQNMEISQYINFKKNRKKFIKLLLKKLPDDDNIFLMDCLILKIFKGLCLILQLFINYQYNLWRLLQW